MSSASSGLCQNDYVDIVTCFKSTTFTNILAVELTKIAYPTTGSSDVSSFEGYLASDSPSVKARAVSYYMATIKFKFYSGTAHIDDGTGNTRHSMAGWEVQVRVNWELHKMSSSDPDYSDVADRIPDGNRYWLWKLVVKYLVTDTILLCNATLNNVGTRNFINLFRDWLGSQNSDNLPKTLYTWVLPDGCPTNNTENPLNEPMAQRITSWYVRRDPYSTLDPDDQGACLTLLQSTSYQQSLLDRVDTGSAILNPDNDIDGFMFVSTPVLWDNYLIKERLSPLGSIINERLYWCIWDWGNFGFGYTDFDDGLSPISYQWLRRAPGYGAQWYWNYDFSKTKDHSATEHVTSSSHSRIEVYANSLKLCGEMILSLGTYTNPDKTEDVTNYSMQFGWHFELYLNAVGEDGSLRWSESALEYSDWSYTGQSEYADKLNEPRIRLPQKMEQIKQLVTGTSEKLNKIYPFFLPLTQRVKFKNPRFDLDNQSSISMVHTDLNGSLIVDITLEGN